MAHFLVDIRGDAYRAMGLLGKAGGGSRIGGQLVFHNLATGRTLTATYSVYVTGDTDINSQGCTWQGTVTAAG